MWGEQAKVCGEGKVSQMCFRGEEGVGTRKREFCNEITKDMVKVVGKISSRFFISKHVGQRNGKKVWWFVVKAQERDLVTLDEQCTWKHKYWRWQKVGRGEHDFLGWDLCWMGTGEGYW